MFKLFILFHLFPEKYIPPPSISSQNASCHYTFQITLRFVPQSRQPGRHYLPGQTTTRTARGTGTCTCDPADGTGRKRTPRPENQAVPQTANPHGYNQLEQRKMHPSHLGCGAILRPELQGEQTPASRRFVRWLFVSLLFFLCMISQNPRIILVGRDL